MRNKKNRLIRTITTLALAAALALIGTVPSFADESTFEGAPDGPDIVAEGALVMDAGSGQILYEKNGDKVRDPASVTKVLNLLVCLDTLDFNEVVTVDRNVDNMPSTMELQKGETLKTGDLIYAMMLWSANDAAEYLGYLAGGNMETFCEMMNKKAAACGATQTKYKNPNGLNPDAVNNQTTPHDIALVMRQAMKDERFREIVGTAKYYIPETNKHKERKIINSNKCLWNQEKIDELAALEKEAKENPPVYHYDELTGVETVDSATEARNKKISKLKKKTRYMIEGCIGGKTGYTSTAGGCYVGYATRGNTDIIVVVMKSDNRTTRFQDAVKLWNYAYENFETYTAAKTGYALVTIKVKRGSLRDVDLGVAEDLKVTELKGTDASKSVTTEVQLNEEKPLAPIPEGTVLGQIIAYDNGEEVSRQDLIALETVEEGGPLSYIGIADEDVPVFLIMLGTAILTLIIIIRVIVIIRRRRRTVAGTSDKECEDGDSGEH